MLSREDYRKIKSMSKEEMNRWLDLEKSMMYNRLRKDFEKAYKDELDCGVSNFLIAMWYTLHFNEDLHLKNDELASFMEDLFISVDMFRRGEYKPDEYREQLKEDGVQFAEFDYSKLYRDRVARVQKAIDEKKIHLNDEMTKDDFIKILDEIAYINKDEK